MRARTWVLGAAGSLLLALVLGLTGGLAWLRGAPGQAWLLTKVLAIAQPHAGSLEVARLRTDLLTQLVVEGVVLKDAQGKELAGCDAISLDFRLDAVLKRTVVVRRAQVRGLRADLRLDDAGLDIAEIWGDPTRPPAPSTGPGWSGLPITLRIEGIDIEASTLRMRLKGQDLALADARLLGALSFVGDEIRVQDIALHALSSPDLGPLALRGALM